MKKRSRIFDKDYAPYGRYEGERGNPQQWADAFKARFSDTEISEILGADDPWSVLGLRPGATQAQIRKAFLKRTLETHPDRNPQLKGDTAPFRKVKAAYDKLSA